MRIGIDAHMVGRRETGNESYIVGLVSGLSRVDEQHEYCVFTLDRPQPLAGLNASRFEIQRIWPANGLVRIPVSMPLLARHQRLDLLHMTYIAPPVCPCPTVVAVHDISFAHFPEFFSPQVQLVLSTLVPISLRRAAQVLTLSNHTKREITARYHIPEDRITVTHAAASRTYRPIPEVEARARLDGMYRIPDRFILAVGNIQPRKNLTRLVQAYARLRHRGDLPHKLVVVGQSSWHASPVFEAVERNGLSDEVVFTGYVPEADLCLLYNLAELFVYPSLYEGFGLPPLEAMACGTPTITSDTSSLPEVVGDAALMFDPYRVEDIASAIASVASDANLREKLSTRGLEQACQFSWEKTAERALASFEEACA